MSDREKIKEYLIQEMEKISHETKDKYKDHFHFCWCQAKFDTLMDIDVMLKLGAFTKVDKP